MQYKEAFIEQFADPFFLLKNVDFPYDTLDSCFLNV